MHPVLLSLGHFRIYSYGALIALGGVFASIFWLKHWKPMGLKKEDDVWILVNTLIISGFLGGRILYVFQYDPWFGRAFFSDLFSLNRGFCVMGAILSVILGIYLYARFLKLQFLRTLDYVCQAAPLWHFFGRLGCFSADKSAVKHETIAEISKKAQFAGAKRVPFNQNKKEFSTDDGSEKNSVNQCPELFLGHAGHF